MHAGIMNRQVNQNDPEWLGFIKMDKHQSQCACQSYNSKKTCHQDADSSHGFCADPIQSNGYIGESWHGPFRKTHEDTQRDTCDTH